MEVDRPEQVCYTSRPKVRPIGPVASAGTYLFTGDDMRYRTRGTLIGLAVLILVARMGTLHAQTASGNVSGTVRDAGGGVLPGVSVTARNLETGAVRTALTDAGGTYQILSVPAADYAV